MTHPHLKPHHSLILLFIVQSQCLTLCDPMDCSTRQASLSFTTSWSLLQLMTIELVMPSNHLILCLPFLFLPSIFPSIRVFSNELVLLTKWPKYGSFSLNISPSKEYSGLNPFRIDSFDLLSVQGTLKRVFSSNTARKHLSLLYGSTLTYVHDCQKNHSFDYMDFCWQSDVSAFEYTVWVCHSFPSKEQASFNFLLPHLIFLGVLETLWKHFEFLNKSLFPVRCLFP